MVRSKQAALPTWGIPGSASVLPASRGTGWVQGAGVQLQGHSHAGSPCPKPEQKHPVRRSAPGNCDCSACTLTSSPQHCASLEGWDGPPNLTGPPLKTPIFLAQEQYLKVPCCLSTRATQALEADGAGHQHLGHHQCFCHMSGLMQKFQYSPLSQNKPRDRFLCLSPPSSPARHCLLLFPPVWLFAAWLGSVLLCSSSLGPVD